jgi:hypothetical protein
MATEKVTPPSLRRVVADPTQYTKLMLQTGPFGCAVDLCLTCGAMLPTGVEVGGETPQQAHTRFHAAHELTVQVVNAWAAKMMREANGG